MNKAISQKIYFLSFLCMVLLVFIHSYNVTDFPLNASSTIDEPLTLTNFIEYFLANGLLRFRIPLLMAISGYLVAYKQDVTYLQLVTKKLRTLILPYLLFSLLSLAAIALVEYCFMANAAEGLWGKKINTYGAYDFFYRIVISPMPFQLWYLRILFVFTIVYPAIRCCIQKAPIPLLIILFCLRLGFNSNHYTLIFYFAIGVFLQLKAINITTKPAFLNSKLWLLAVLVLITFKTFVAFHGKAIFGDYTGFVLNIIHLAHVIPTIFLIWFGIDKLANYCMNQRWFQSLSTASFFIFACHEPLMVMLIKPYVAFLGGGESAKFIAFFTLPLAMLVFCIGLNTLVFKISPALYGLLTGGRGSTKK
ncbi:acyltransferase family protein [Parasediminibacterium paludis]|uniref:Acyltransferase family protein n=1 Tax=Parasediminibacterium paludis TaxID=908966 RepID=A0ABV8PZI2_9BACT